MASSRSVCPGAAARPPALPRSGRSFSVNRAAHERASDVSRAPSSSARTCRSQSARERKYGRRARPGRSTAEHAGARVRDGAGCIVLKLRTSPRPERSRAMIRQAVGGETSSRCLAHGTAIRFYTEVLGLKLTTASGTTSRCRPATRCDRACIRWSAEVLRAGHEGVGAGIGLFFGGRDRSGTSRARLRKHGVAVSDIIESEEAIT